LHLRQCAVVFTLLCIIAHCALATSPADSSILSLSKDIIATLVAQGKFVEALDQVHEYLLSTRSPADPAWVVKTLDSVQSSDPKPNADTLEKLGDCYRMTDSFAKAVKCYEAVLRDPSLSTRDASADTGRRIRRWLIKCHIRNKEWGKVEKEIDAIAAESPECAAWSYYSLGCYYQRYRKYPQAISCLMKAAPADKTLPAPDAKSVDVALVDCYTGARKWDNATALLKKLSEQYPKEAGRWHECAGAIYQGRKKYAEAIAELKQAIERATARKRLGECYRDSMTSAEAAPLIEDLVTKYPTDGPYLPTIAGRLYQDMKQYDKAVALLKFVIEHFPNARWQVWDACYYIGECAFAQGEDKGGEALAYIKDFYARHLDRPMDFAIAYGKTLLFPADKPAEAAELIAKTMAEHPKDSLASELRPLLIAAYSNSNQIDKLAEVLNAMAKEAPAAKKPGILLALIDHYVLAGKYREAAALCRAVLALRESSDDARAHAEYQLGICYRNSNMDTAARQAMRNVVERYSHSEWAKQAQIMVCEWDAHGGS